MKRIVSILVVISLGVFLIACGGDKEEPVAKTDSMEKAAPVAEASAPETAPAEYSYDLANGEAVYKKFCFACHDGGLAGAAKHADTQRWAESAAKGVPMLVKHVTEGYQGKYGMLPPKGTCMDCSEQDLIDAVHYQLKMGGALK